MMAFVKRQGMAILASIWLLAAVAGLIKGESSWGAICGVVSLMLWDRYRREMRNHAKAGSAPHNEA
jgi:hypothetical protein